MMNKILTPAEKDFLVVELAQQNNVEAALLRAIVEVESSGQGFYDANSPYAGKCKVRFEPDYFTKFAGGSKPFFLPPHLSPEQAKKDNRYTGRLAYEQALLQSPTAAIKSTSFGLGQVMGFNYETVGYNSLSDFTQDMEDGEYYQLMAMLRFIVGNTPLKIAVQQRDFVEIARLYNGPNFMEHAYHQKIQNYYRQFSQYQPGVSA